MPRSYEYIPEPEFVSPFSMPKLRTDLMLALYGRQSQKDGPIKHKESYELQTVRLVEYAHHLGWQEQRIMVFIENKRKDGKWRKASGMLRIDQREGLQSIVELIIKDEVKCVLVWAVDRLFRHEDMVEPAMFVKTCKEHNCIILLHDGDFFDFNNPIRGDRKRFLRLAEQAADFISEHVKKRMIPAKNLVSRRGEFDGRAVSIGFILLEDEKKPHEYKPHADVIRSIFKRFKELDGRFHALWKEVALQPELFPAYPPEARGVRDAYKKEGPFGISRYGLHDLLTNTVYIGWWYFKEKGKSAIIHKNNHDAIVDEEDFWYAFARLSKEPIEGEERSLPVKKPPVRFHRVGTVPVEALLNGIITSSLQGYSIYVFPRTDNPRRADYKIEKRSSIGEIDQRRDSISTKYLDEIFTEKLKERLRLFQAMDAIQAIARPGQPLEVSMYQYLQQIQQNVVVQSNEGVKKQLEEYQAEAASLDRTLHYGAAALSPEKIEKYSKRLAHLETTISILKKKADEPGSLEEKLKENASLLAEASQSYENMSFERKQKLIRHITTKVELSSLAPHWLRLEIEWSPFMGVAVKDLAYIWRTNSTESVWNDKEDTLLREMYTTADRDSILKELPTRNWTGIIQRANEIGGLRRSNHMRNNSPLPDRCSYEDYEFMRTHKLIYDAVNEPKKRVWWKLRPVRKMQVSQRSPATSGTGGLLSKNCCGLHADCDHCYG